MMDVRRFTRICARRCNMCTVYVCVCVSKTRGFPNLSDRRSVILALHSVGSGWVSLMSRVMVKLMDRPSGITTQSLKKPASVDRRLRGSEAERSRSWWVWSLT